MHQVSGTLNMETAAFIAAALSYGSRKQFLPKIGDIISASAGEPYSWVRDGAFSKMFSPSDNSSFYRLYSHRQMHLFFSAYCELLVRYGSLHDYVCCCASTAGKVSEDIVFYGAKSAAGNLPACGITALTALRLITSFFASHGGTVVIPKDVQSCCKRLCMFLRWMVRDGSPVDIGIWSDIISRRTLIMPLDTHVMQQARRLHLTDARCTSMRTALALSATVAEVFPDDPLKADFALFGYGVNA